MMAAAGTKFAEPKYPGLVYPEEAAYNPSLNPDNYPLWKSPTSWKKVAAEFVTITPEIAKKLLAHRNPKNQVRTKQSWINQLRFRMDNGQWALMETIEFDWDGFLGNGHHRIEAIASSKAAVVVLVVYGLNPENYYRYDDNFKRTSENVIAMYLEKAGLSPTEAKTTAKVAAPATAWTRLYWDGDSLESRRLIEKAERLEVVEMRPDLLQAYKDIKRLLKKYKVKKAPVTEPVLTALLTLGGEVNKSRSLAFLEGVISNSDGDGHTLKEGDPRYLYQKFLENNRDSKGKNRVYTHFKFERGLQALRQFLDGNTKMKSWPRGPKPDVPRLSEQQDKFFAELAAEQAAQKAADKRLKAFNNDTKAAAVAA